MLYLLLIIPAVAFFLWLMLSVQPRIKEKKRQERLAIFNQLKPEVEKAFSQISSLYNFNHYITETERLSLLEDYNALDSEVRPLLNSKELEEFMYKDAFRRFHNAMTDTTEHKKSNNIHFVENQLSFYSEYFDSVLTYPLDPQQREAIVSLEDNVLVISSAGSGKTMTTVGKVRYLIDKQHVPAEKILLITFTRKAAQSLSERLGEKKLKCRTFHKLALEIIGKATGEKPSITSEDFPKQVYYKLSEENQAFRTAITDYIIRARYTMKDQFEYTSREEYMQDRQLHGIHAYFKDMDGKPVFCKSDEECQICDFLGARGIPFRYEEKYEINTADANYRQYKPDFSIYIDDPDGGQRRIYLEHFAVNEKGRCPEWFTPEDEVNYLEGVEWKRQLHRDSGTTLIETCSADFHRGEVSEKLSKQLLDLGAVFSETNSEKVSRELHRQEDNILSLLTSFIFLMKSRAASLDEIRQRVNQGPDRVLLTEIIAPYIEAYKNLEEEFDEIDFTDAIIQATDLCNHGHKPNYDYILVQCNI